MRTRTFTLAVAFSALAVTPALAHKGSDSYLFLQERVHGLSGHWDLSLYDLDAALGLDQGDGSLTWGEVRSRGPEIADFVQRQLSVERDGKPCPLSFGELGLVEHSDGRYARFELDVSCADQARGAFEIEDHFLFEQDPLHRSIVRFVGTTGSERVSVIRAETESISLSATPGKTGGDLGAFVAQGVRHILDGIDHVLFLLALLMPAVLRREMGVWLPAASLRSVARDVVGTVTAFTVAHSLTLSLTALGWVHVSARVIEPAIAASVAIAALDNLWPVLGGDRWAPAFSLGLLHGFGLASALVDADLRGPELIPALFGFNLGVELGQLAIVLAFVPLAFLMRRAPAYRTWGMRIASAVVLVMSVAWIIQRVQVG